MSSAEYRKRLGLTTNPPNVQRKPSIRIPKPTEIKMSKPERDFARVAAVVWPKGDGYRVDYEGMKLKLPSGSFYGGDFIVWAGSSVQAIVEVKGAYRLHSQAVSSEKFKAAKVAYPSIDFIFAQLTKDGWATVPNIFKP